MELSKQKQNEAKKLGVTLQYVVMADLMAIGYDEGDAYTIAYPENTALSAQQNISIRRGIVESAKFTKILENRMERVKEGIAAPVSLDEVALVDTQAVLKEILRSAYQQPVGSKERADLFAKYNDIKKDNENTVSNGIDNIHFVLPLKCNQCPLLSEYNRFRKEKNLKELRPVEMEHVMRAAHIIIDEATKKEE